MKTLEEIKNEVAVKHGYEDWGHIIHEFRHHNMLKAELNVLVNESMQLYAEQIAIKACELQKELCSESAKAFISTDDSATISKGSILNSPTPDIKQLIK